MSELNSLSSVALTKYIVHSSVAQAETLYHSGISLIIMYMQVILDQCMVFNGDILEQATLTCILIILDRELTS